MDNASTHLRQQAEAFARIIRRTVQRVAEERVAEAAASMAYYGLFSLFPLLLLAIAILSTVLKSASSEEEILETILRFFPFAHDLIAENIRQVINARGSGGVIGTLGLAWAAMGAFTVLVRNINRAWPNAKARTIIRMRLMSLVMIAALIAGLLTLFVSTTVLSLLPPGINHLAEEAASIKPLSDLAMSALLFVILMVLYWWLPSTRVCWSDAAWGALASSISIALVTRIFTWYLGSGLSTYNLVYGSLGAIVALLFWIYVLSFIIFIGAHLSAAIAHQRQPSNLS